MELQLLSVRCFDGMKLVLAVLLGLLLAAHVAADSDSSDDDGGHSKKSSCRHHVYTCVESKEHCWKEEVCEEVEKVACGKEWCKYPEVCKYDKKKVCKNVTKYKKECAAPEHTCVEELTECGDLKCKYDEECTTVKVCEVVEQKFEAPAKPASASASASASSTGGSASAYASAKSVSTGTTYAVKPVKVCHDEYACTPKDPCETVYSQKCVHAELSEKKSYEGRTFEWMKPWEVGMQCGKGYCKEGYKCANVEKKVCPEAVECGDKVCDPGYKCALKEVHCKEIPYTTPVCEDVKVGACFMPHDWVDYKPSCQTVWKCKESPCGDGYCKAGTACHEDYVACAHPPPKKHHSDESSD